MKLPDEFLFDFLPLLARVEPDADVFSALAGAQDEVVHPAIRLLPAFVAVLRRYLSVPAVESRRKVDALTYVPRVMAYQERIHAGARCGVPAETTEGTIPVMVQPKSGRLRVVGLRQEPENIPIRIAVWFKKADKLETVMPKDLWRRVRHLTIITLKRACSPAPGDNE